VEVKSASVPAAKCAYLKLTKTSKTRIGITLKNVSIAEHNLNVPYLVHHCTQAMCKCLDFVRINPLNAELNPICHLLALLGAHHIFHVSGIKVKL